MFALFAYTYTGSNVCSFLRSIAESVLDTRPPYHTIKPVSGVTSKVSQVEILFGTETLKTPRSQGFVVTRIFLYGLELINLGEKLGRILDFLVFR